MSSLDFVHHGYSLTVGRHTRSVFPVALGYIDFRTIFIQTGCANTQRRNCSILYHMIAVLLPWLPSQQARRSRYSRGRSNLYFRSKP
jgi:hypothetical protein